VIVAGWLREVLDQLGSISLPILLLALTLHTCETLLNAFAWRNMDAELALLTCDSTQGSAVAAPTRAEAASIRALTFSSPRLTIELEVAEDSLLGQVVPAKAAMIEVETRDGAETPALSDEIGCFSVYPIPVGPFRIRCRTADSTDVLTGWITL
jgi:hypothetical protein